MDGDHVSPHEELRQPDQLCRVLGSLLGGQVRVGGQDAHVECGGAAGDRLADLPQADDAQRPVPELRPGEAAALPLAATDRRVRGGDLAQQREHQGERVLGGGDRVAGRGVDHHDPGAGGRRQVDPIGADRGDPHHGQTGRSCAEELGVYPGLGTDHQPVPAGPLPQCLQQPCTRQVQAHGRLVHRGQQVDAGRRHGFGDEDASHGPSLRGRLHGVPHVIGLADDRLESQPHEHDPGESGIPGGSCGLLGHSPALSALLVGGKLGETLTQLR